MAHAQVAYVPRITDAPAKRGGRLYVQRDPPRPGGGTALDGPLDGHFTVPLVAAAGCALLFSTRTAPAPTPV
ncbi:hypothetical protein [Streptomyces sp. NPDC001494]